MVKPENGVKNFRKNVGELYEYEVQHPAIRYF